MYQIREEKEAMLPRERLVAYGETNLSNVELMSILLRTGSSKENVYHLSQNVFDRFSTLYDLKKATLEELEEISGIGRVKAIQIRAAIELGKRIQIANQELGFKVRSSKELGNQLIQEMKDLTQEYLVVIFLNTKNRTIKKRTIFIGSLNQSVAHPREIFREAVRISAASIILVHNHPSGNPTPSENDKLLTEQVNSVGKEIGIALLDHIVVGGEDYFSFKENQIFHSEAIRS